MSSDVIEFNDNPGIIRPRALKLFLEMTLPLMLLTFGAWYGIYWRSKRKEEQKYKETGQNFRDSSLV
jgi:hypothetical protein